MRNLQEQVKKAFCYQKLFCPFTVWMNCSSDLKIFADSQPSASNFKSFSQSLDQFFLTVHQNNFVNKISFTLIWLQFFKFQPITMKLYNQDCRSGLWVVDRWGFCCKNCCWYVSTLHYYIFLNKVTTRTGGTSHPGKIMDFAPKRSFVVFALFHWNWFAKTTVKSMVFSNRSRFEVLWCQIIHRNKNSEFVLSLSFS